MGQLTFRRIAAYAVDYVIVVSYALLLFGIASLLNLKDLTLTPISGQLLGFTSLTLPVFFYFYLMEKSKTRATIGKKLMHIYVSSEAENKGSKILLRNVLKFLPWEVAHTGVHWIIFYSESEKNVPIWVWIVLILPQIMMFAYLISIMILKGESSIYDTISNTTIKRKQLPQNM